MAHNVSGRIVTDYEIYQCLMDARKICQDSGSNLSREAFSRLLEVCSKTNHVARNLVGQSWTTAITGAFSATLTFLSGASAIGMGLGLRQHDSEGLVKVFTALSHVCDIAGKAAGSAEEADKMQAQQAVEFARSVHDIVTSALRENRQTEQSNANAIDSYIRYLQQRSPFRN